MRACLILLFSLAATGCGALEREVGKKVDKIERKVDKNLDRAVGAVGDAVSGGKKGGTGGKKAAGLPSRDDPCAALDAGGSFTLEVPFDGTDWPVEVYLPAGAGPHPMVVLLHGGDDGAGPIKKQTEYVDLAEERGFVVAVPEAVEIEGRGLRWNTGKWPEAAQRDDSAFLDALVRRAKSELCVDKALGVGFSAGAQMCNRWACEGTEVDAVAFSAGALLIDPATCTDRAIPILSFVGTKDKVFDGSPRPDKPELPSVPASAELWTAHNGCAGNGKPSRIGKAECTTWDLCSAPVMHCNVVGFPHAWPGGKKKADCDFDATPVSWDWFRGL
ncbi:MAG: poly(3-hydroxybutyrate) depolymerase [Myxococcota bacterium]|jgi:poly(3-hydroxybutyrate) depolymerase